MLLLDVEKRAENLCLQHRIRWKRDTLRLSRLARKDPCSGRKEGDKEKRTLMSITKTMESLLTKDYKVPDNLVNMIGNRAAAELIIGAQLIKKAIHGDIKATREIMDRVEGKAVQRTEITGKDGGPIDVTETNRQLLISKLVPESLVRGEISKTTDT